MSSEGHSIISWLTDSHETPPFWQSRPRSLPIFACFAHLERLSGFCYCCSWWHILSTTWPIKVLWSVFSCSFFYCLQQLTNYLEYITIQTSSAIFREASAWWCRTNSAVFSMTYKHRYDNGVVSFLGYLSKHFKNNCALGLSVHYFLSPIELEMALYLAWTTHILRWIRQCFCCEMSHMDGKKSFAILSPIALHLL